MNENDMLYTVKEVSKILRCSTDYVYKLRDTGLLKFMKLGHYKVRREELARFLRECEGLDVTDPSDIKKLNTHR